MRWLDNALRITAMSVALSALALVGFIVFDRLVGPREPIKLDRAEWKCTDERVRQLPMTRPVPGGGTSVTFMLRAECFRYERRDRR